MKIRNILRIAVVTSILSLSMVAGMGTNKALAAPGDTATCYFTNAPTNPSEVGQNLAITPTTISTTLVLVGDANCRRDVNLAVWKLPFDTLQVEPFEEQILFDYDSRRGLTPGTYTLTADLPDCFYQADVAVGANPAGPTGRLPLEPGRMWNAAVGGTKKCEEKKPQPKPTSTKPTTPTVVKVVSQPVALPRTGAGSVVATGLGVATLSGAAHSLVQRRRNRG